MKKSLKIGVPILILVLVLIISSGCFVMRGYFRYSS